MVSEKRFSNHERKEQHMKIGENIRANRLKKGMTQEQLAEVFSVSPQAVSRWENETAYPDLTILCALAVYFDTTADALLGMDDMKKAEALNQVHRQVQVHVAAGERPQAVALLRQSLRQYPQDAGLMQALCETLASESDDAAWDEAIALSAKLMQHPDASTKAKVTSTANLAYLYRQKGERDMAQAISVRLPHIWESREYVQADFSENSKEALQEWLMQMLLLMRRRIRSTSDDLRVPAHLQLGMDLKSDCAPLTILEEIREYLAGTQHSAE